MTKQDIDKIIDLHKKWLAGKSDGEYADLRHADLRHADLSGVNLSGANLSGADLRRADLRHADLRHADLSGVNLSGANLSGADLRRADLRHADLSGVNLSGANLSGADLRRADLRHADLSGVNLSGANLSDADLSDADLRRADHNQLTAFFTISCPEEGSFIAFKKCKGLIVKLEIPSDAKRSSATTLKCRASKAKCLEIENGLTEISSDYDSRFIYKVGETVEVSDFNEDRWNECSTGIHFFMSKEVAKNYN
jgi:uncharacterized protein YjbI with pentapeptide repeats